MTQHELFVDDASVFLDDDPSEESEDDLDSSSYEQTQAVVTATDWTVETVLNQLARGNIELNPSFQRRDAWTNRRKGRFIESLFLGLPVPQLVLAERQERRGSFIVIDGKQRLLSLSQFDAGGTVSRTRGEEKPTQGFDALKLVGLEVLDILNNLKLGEIEDQAEYENLITAFENQTIRTVVVRNWSDEDFLYRVFLRLNTGSLPLSPQELRQALNPGPFIDYADEFSGDSPEIRRALRLSKPDFRMRDVELFIRFIAFQEFLPRYDGNLKGFLDLTCQTLNEQWSSREDELTLLSESCNHAIGTVFEIFGEDAFRRWNGSKFESRFNRAVFDAQVFFLADAVVAGAAMDRKELVLNAFKRVSLNEQFADSVTATTKSIDATYLRLSRWGGELAAVLDVDIPTIELVENRITTN